jgi:hypothetical protein
LYRPHAPIFTGGHGVWQWDFAQFLCSHNMDGLSWRALSVGSVLPEYFGPLRAVIYARTIEPSHELFILPSHASLLEWSYPSFASFASMLFS